LFFSNSPLFFQGGEDGFAIWFCVHTFQLPDFVISGVLQKNGWKGQKEDFRLHLLKKTRF